MIEKKQMKPMVLNTNIMCQILNDIFKELSFNSKEPYINHLLSGRILRGGGIIGEVGLLQIGEYIERTCDFIFLIYKENINLVRLII